MLVNTKQKSKKRFTSRLSRGFSLAEILIVLVIMMIISAVGLYTLQVVSQRGKGQATTESLKALILQAKNIAMTGQGINFGTEIKWVRVEVDSTDKEAEIILVYKNGVTLTPVAGSKIKLDIEKIIFQNMSYDSDPTSNFNMTLCTNSSTINTKPICSFDFIYQGIKTGQIEAQPNSQEAQIYLVDNFGAGNISDVVVHKVLVDKLSGNVRFEKTDGSLRPI